MAQPPPLIARLLRRTEKISSNVQLATPSAAYPTEVTVGGATLFVSDVTQFEKI